MRRYESPNKTKQEWEAEMLECLEHARQHLSLASGAERMAALQHYREVLEQFHGLTLHGKIPPEKPCYT